MREVYSFILGEYLPTRYPTMFQLTPDGSTFHNLVTGREYPSEAAADGDMDAALRVIGENTDDDMFILRETPEGHVADAFMCCCPAGFDPSSKLGKLLKDIHKPVPSYEKIGKSMEKFFSRAEVGKGARRINVSHLCVNKDMQCMLIGCSGRSRPTTSCSSMSRMPRWPTAVPTRRTSFV